MTANIPTSPPSWAAVTDAVDDVMASHMNDAWAEIIAMAADIYGAGVVGGLKQGGSSFYARWAVGHNADGTHKGAVPIGGAIFVFTAMTGCPTPATADGWAACDGTTAASQGVTSPTITSALPNINSGAFIRGNSTSWSSGGASGGANTVNLAHDHTYSNTTGSGGADHTHPLNPTIGAGTAHSHGPGTLQFKTMQSQNSPFYLNGYDISGGNIPVLQFMQYAGTGSVAWTLSGQALDQCYTKDGGGATANESAHTHTLTASETGLASAIAHTHANSGTSSSSLSASQSVLPTYFSATCYMRVK